MAFDYKNLPGLAGSFNDPGLKKKVYYAPVSAFTTIAAPTTKDTGAASDVVIAESHVFQEGEYFREMYTTLDAGKLLSESVGERDGRGHSTKIEVFHPGSKWEAIAFADVCQNDEYIFLVEGLDGTLYQVGSDSMGVGITANFDSGTVSSGRKGFSFAIDTFGLFFIYQGTVTKKEPEHFDLHISVLGNDENEGTSLEDSVKTIERLQTLALEMGNGVAIKFYNELQYRAELNLSTLQNVIIDAGFSSLDASEIITGTWTQPDAVTYPNVWQISIDHNMITSSDDRIIILEDGLPMSIQNSLANVNSVAGSRHVLNDSALATNDPTTVYIHASGSGNPNSNGKQYEASLREGALRVGNNAKVVNFLGKNGGHNYGSLHGGNAQAIIERVLLYNSTRHAFVFAGAVANDVIAYQADHDRGDGQYAFTCYRTTPQNTDKAEFNRCFVLEGKPVGGKTSMGGFYHHGLTASAAYQLVKYNQCFTRKMSTKNKESFGGISLAFELLNSYSFDIYRGVFPVCNTLLVNRFQLKDCSGAFLYLGITPSTGDKLMNSEVKNCALQSTVSFSYPFALYAHGTHSLHHNSLHAGVLGNLLETYHANATVDFRYNVCRFSSLNRVIKIATGGTYTGDYNIFLYTGTGDMKFEKEGTISFGLAAWQTASGQDANSVYLTAAQAADFWLGDPAQGDFRINPNAKVTAANGTVLTGVFPDGTLITAAGVQEHWNWNTRQVVAGTPTKWPVPPVTETEAKAYIKKPKGWKFYPTA